jgi:hypothetical protein
MSIIVRFLLLVSLCFTCACKPKELPPSFQSVRLINHTENTVAYEISVNGKPAEPVNLHAKEGLHFVSSTPAKDPVKINFKGHKGARFGFNGTSVQLDTIVDGEGFVSPQGSFSGVRYYYFEAARAQKKPEWKEIVEENLATIEIQIK